MKKAVIFLFCTVLYLFTWAQMPQWKSNNIDSIHYESGLPVISIENAIVTEGDNGACYMVLFLSLSKRSKDPVKVQYYTASNTDSKEEDYLQKKGSITFPANRLLQTVRIQVDCEVHNTINKTFSVKLSGAVNATPEHVTAIGTINNTNAVSTVNLNKSQF
jgi:endoglucanase